eukprot:8517119-Lingulodinium_polyedra.AAC.1
MDPHSTGRQPTAAPNLQENLRLDAPAFSPSGGGRLASYPRNDAQMSSRSPASNQMLGDQIYPTIA